MCYFKWSYLTNIILNDVTCRQKIRVIKSKIKTILYDCVRALKRTRKSHIFLLCLLFSTFLFLDFIFFVQNFFLTYPVSYSQKNVCLCVCVCVWVCVCVCVCVFKCERERERVRVCCVTERVYVSVCFNVCAYFCLCVWEYVLVCVCVSEKECVRVSERKSACVLCAVW